MNVWLMAARPKTLTAALIPVVVGTTLAGLELSINWSLVISSLVCALCVQIGTNLINDALDFKKGADTEKRIGPVRVTQSGLLSGSQVLAGGMAFLLIGILFGLPLVIQGGPIIAIMLAVSVLLAYLYTGGPYPLAYKGLGEVFVFLFFGLIGTAGAYYIQTLHLSTQALVAGAQVGLLATLLIAVNNVRDVHGDSLVNKRTLAVRYGVHFGKCVITLCALTPFILTYYWFSVHCMTAAILPWLCLPLALLIVRSVWQSEPSGEYNRFLAQSALLHLLFGTLLTGGLLL